MAVQSFDQIKILRRLRRSLERLETRLLAIEVAVLKKILNDGAV